MIPEWGMAILYWLSIVVGVVVGLAQIIICFAYAVEPDARKDFGGHWFLPFIMYHYLVRPWLTETGRLQRRHKKLTYKLERMQRIEAERKKVQEVAGKIEELEIELRQMAFRTPDLWLKQEGRK